MDTRPTAGSDAAPSIAPAIVLVAADDLIWASRLRTAVERSGATAIVGLRSDTAARGAVVDLGLRRDDAIALITTLTGSGVPVIAVGQHDDVALRKRALAAGAGRVYSYDKLFRDGPGVIRAWLQGLPS